MSAGAHIVAASGSAGNTVSVNLAAGDATSASLAATAAAAANIATGNSATMQLNIDGTAVNANFSNDVNAPGTAAVFSSQTLGANVDVSSIQGGKASLTGNAVGTAGANGTLAANLGDYVAVVATTTGSKVTLGGRDSCRGHERDSRLERVRSPKGDCLQYVAGHH